MNIGSQYGRLVVEDICGPRGGVVQVRCAYGKILMLPRHRLASGNTKSCGCLKKDATRARHTTHGEIAKRQGKRVASAEYRSWQSMRNRCFNSRSKDYPYYGGRGISVTPDWDTFEQFLLDMGRKPSPKHTLERIETDRGYAPENCCWATREAQSRNRPYANIRAWELAAKLGVKQKSIYHYVWQVRAKDKGMTRWCSMSPEKEHLIREYLEGR